MSKLTAIALALVMVMAAGIASATEFSHDTSDDSKGSKEKSLSQKTSQDEKVSDTKRKSKSKSTGKDKTDSDSDKKSGSLGENRGLDIQIQAAALFTEIPLPGPYKLPVDFGWTGEEEGGRVINTSTADYYRGRAANNSRLEPEEQEAVAIYALQVMRAGAQTGQAILYLQDMVAKFGAVTRDKKGNIEVVGLGQDDLITLADGAMIAAGKPEGLKDKRIKAKLDKVTTAPFPSCRFAGDLTSIQCGTISLTLSSPPTVKLQAVEWFRLGEGGAGSFAGLSSSYKVSSAWSWSKMLEDAKNNSRFTKLAQEASTSAEKMESEGRGFDAVMVRKKSLDAMTANKAGVGPGKFMPGIH